MLFDLLHRHLLSFLVIIMILIGVSSGVVSANLTSPGKDLLVEDPQVDRITDTPGFAKKALPVAPPVSTHPTSEMRKRNLNGRKSDQLYRGITISEDTTWHGEIMVEGGVTVASHATLTILPGAIIHFRVTDQASLYNANLLVQGRLLAVGTAEKPIIFTGAYDDTEPGDWQGIILLGSEKKNLLEYCRIEGGVIGIDAAYSTLTLKNTSLVKCLTGTRLQDCLVVMAGGGASSCRLGMIMTDSEADIRDASFSSNRQGLLAVRSSLYLSGATLYGNEFEALSAENCKIKVFVSSFTVNGNGASLVASEGGVTNSRFLKNVDYGLMLAKSRVKVNNNEISQNGRIGLRVEDGLGIAWGNNFSANGAYDLYNAGTEEFRAIGNWWGGVSATDVNARIYDYQKNNNRGRVVFLPMLPQKPQTGM